MDSYNSPTTKPLFHASQMVWYILSIIEVLLALRIFLKLFAANPTAGFSSIIYGASYPFVAPFLAVFRTTNVSGNIFEWTTVLAMFVYWLIAIGIVRFLIMSKTVSTPEAAEKLNTEI
jgi:hypothetical protein